MGVHYFYTWITRRYPLFRRTFDEQVMPQVDNFFIDLNGVLYRCAKDDSAVFKDVLSGKGFDEIFQAVLNYINFIVNHARPRKRLFIAVDGVAPRAKMNNQRQRRYHSAKNNKDMNFFLQDTLQTTPGVVNFKNNSISPGTEFMMELIKQVNFFLQRKIAEDPAWKNIEVIFSGGDVAGEGEHKIMEWLRAWKQGPTFDINESHCVYGNDSDLIFLCLSLHLPNMFILREEMHWDRKKVNTASKRTKSKESMELLFINLLREYMELEYAPYKESFKHEFSIEKIIDDFIMLSFFIGNDFLHKLYCMNIKKGNFDEIIDKFKKTLAGLDGYITDNGKVNWRRFLVLCKAVLYMEPKMIKTTMNEMTDFIKDLEKNSHHHNLLEDVGAKRFKEDRNSQRVGDKNGNGGSKRGRGGQKGRKQRGRGGSRQDHSKKQEEEEEEEKVVGDGGGYVLKKKEGQEEEEGEDQQATTTTTTSTTTANKEEEGEEQERADIEDDEELEDDELTLHEKVNAEFGSSTRTKEESTSVHYRPHELEYRIHHGKIKQETVYIKKLLMTLEKNNNKATSKEKAVFYKKFFEMKKVEDLQTICLEYLKGIQFVMYYYFRGCPSWTWFYPYFMSPFLSDLVSMLDLIIKKNPDICFDFDLEEPFRPFNQLVFILPKASFGLLPPIYSEVILDQANGVTHYYPDEYEFQPFDGIKDYMWIPDIEVINKEELDGALALVDLSKLSEEDILRNRRGKDVIYKWEPEKGTRVIETTLTGLPTFEAPVSKTEINIREEFTFDASKMSLSMEGYYRDSRGFPSLHNAPRIKASLTRVSRRANYDRIIIEIEPDSIDPAKKNRNQLEHYTGRVYYGYPFMLEGYVNTVLTKNRLQNVSSNESRSIDQLVSDQNPSSVTHKYYLVEEQVKRGLYYQQGVDLQTEKYSNDEEIYYEIEKSQSTWRSAQPNSLNVCDSIVQEFRHESLVYPHSLLFRSKDSRNQLNVCSRESEIQREGQLAINLKTGDLIKTKSFESPGKAFSKGIKIRENIIGTSQVIQSKDLLQTEWNVINRKFLEDLGLKAPEEINVVWMLIDSFVVRTDPSKTSALVIGEYFDIGLKFVDIIKRGQLDLTVVTDLAKAVKTYKISDYTLQVKKRHDYVPYNVFLSNEAKGMLKEYIQTFPELKEYILGKNGDWYQNLSRLPKDHNISNIYKKRANFDANIEIFKIYSYILKNKSNSLKLNSALCMNAPKECVKKLVDLVDAQIDSDNKFGGSGDADGVEREVKIDKNCLMVNIPDLMMVGPTYREHPHYPYIGDRVVFVSNSSKHIPFGVTGTVIGTYKLHIEVLFDWPFIGGTDLCGRCPPFRGGVVYFYEIFDLTSWTDQINSRDLMIKMAARDSRFQPREWNGRIDLTLILRRISENKKSYERNSARGGGGRRNQTALKKQSQPFELKNNGGNGGEYYQPKRQDYGYNSYNQSSRNNGNRYTNNYNNHQISRQYQRNTDYQNNRNNNNNRHSQQQQQQYHNRGERRGANNHNNRNREPDHVKNIPKNTISKHTPNKLEEALSFNGGGYQFTSNKPMTFMDNKPVKMVNLSDLEKPKMASVNVADIEKGLSPVQGTQNGGQGGINQKVDNFFKKADQQEQS